MSLKKQVLIKSTGVPATFHVIQNLMLSRQADVSSANVACYYDENAHANGAMPVGQTTVMLPGIAPETNVFDWAEQQLVLPVPPDVTENNVIDPMLTNRYLFANAQIV